MSEHAQMFDTVPEAVAAIEAAANIDLAQWKAMHNIAAMPQRDEALYRHAYGRGYADGIKHGLAFAKEWVRNELKLP